MKNRTRTVLAVLFASLASCATPVTRAEVERLMDVQRAAWNRGDLVTFVSYYDPSMTVWDAGGVTRGIDNLLANYQRRYPTAAARGSLTFELLEVRPVEGNSALVLGMYRLDRAEPAAGYFSLLVARTDAGLRILHDHTSESPK